MALTHLLDTSVYCQPLKPKPLQSVIDRWGSLGDQALCTSIFCETEILQGLEMKGSATLRKAYRDILENRLPILSFDIKAARIYAKMQADFTKSGRRKPVFDLLIASIALAGKLILVTCNYNDFADIAGLTVENWAAL